MNKDRIKHLVGYGSGLGGINLTCGEAPAELKKSSYMDELFRLGLFQWDDVIQSNRERLEEKREGEIQRICQMLAIKTDELTRQKEFFIVVGGDHTSAIGTWSGAYTGIQEQGPMGLIWVDAHMDSHVPETSETGRIHGMPLACLLGYGNPQFTEILLPAPKVKPQQLCLIGIRSYESGEAELLKRLNVRVFFMDEVKRRGLKAVFAEAKEIVSAGTAGFGVSVDVDSIDPLEAPGVDVPEKDGLKSSELIEELAIISQDQRLIGAEVVEFNPCRDVNRATEKIVTQLIAALGGISVCDSALFSIRARYAER